MKKSEARKKFRGSNSLFNACWNQLNSWIRCGAVDMHESHDSTMEFLDAIAAEKVNNPKSKFYIYG